MVDGSRNSLSKNNGKKGVVAQGEVCPEQNLKDQVESERGRKKRSEEKTRSVWFLFCSDAIIICFPKGSSLNSLGIFNLTNRRRVV